jgi:hypothetical protein
MKLCNLNTFISLCHCVNEEGGAIIVSGEMMVGVTRIGKIAK